MTPSGTGKVHHDMMADDIGIHCRRHRRATGVGYAPIPVLDYSPVPKRMNSPTKEPKRQEAKTHTTRNSIIGWTF